MSVAKCHPDRVAYCRGLCRNCYDKWRYKRSPELIEKTRARTRAYHKKWYAANQEKRRASERSKYGDLTIPERRASSYRVRYGITIADYNSMLALQKGVCAICHRPPRGKTKGARLYVDHVRASKVVRGLLCAGCNTAIGQFLHSTTILARAIIYLEKK